MGFRDPALFRGDLLRFGGGGLGLGAGAEEVGGVGDEVCAGGKAGFDFDEFAEVAADGDALQGHAVLVVEDGDLEAAGLEDEGAGGDDEGRVGALQCSTAMISA